MDVEHGAAVAFLVLVVMLSLGGNSLVILSVAKFKHLRNKTNALIVNLAVSDLLGGILPGSYHIITLVTQAEPPGCVVSGFVQVLTLTTSLMTLGAIAVHRVIVVTCSPNLRSRLVTKRSIGLLITSVWCLSLMQLMPSWFGFATLGYDRRKQICSMLAEPTVSSKTVRSVISSVSIAGPCLLIIVCYSRLFWFLHKQAKVTAHSNKTKREIKVSISLFLLFVGYVVCNVPLFTAFTLAVLGKVTQPAFMAGILSAKANTCVNPMIYAWRNENFRTAFRDLLCFCKPKNKVDVSRTGDTNSTNTAPTTNK